MHAYASWLITVSQVSGAVQLLRDLLVTGVDQELTLDVIKVFAEVKQLLRVLYHHLPIRLIHSLIQLYKSNGSCHLIDNHLNLGAEADFLVSRLMQNLLHSATPERVIAIF